MGGYYRLKELGFRLPTGPHILGREAVEPLETASLLVDEARQTAARIVAEAQEEFERQKKRGYEDGLAQARAEAIERLLAENEVLDGKLSEMEAGLTEIVVASVRRLVDGFDDREKAAILVRAALKQMRREKKAEIRVSPALYDHMRKSAGGLTEEFPEIELVDVVEDAELQGAHVIVETAIGRVDGDLGRNMDALADVIFATAGRPAPAETVETVATAGPAEPDGEAGETG